MKKTLKTIIAVALSCTLIISTGAVNKAYADKETKEEAKESVKELISNIKAEEDEAATYQDETVYVIASNDGTVGKVIVNDKFRDNEAGTETFTQTSGSSSENLPVDIKVTYAMDGTEMSASEIAGRSGHVTITYEYTNKESEKVQIGNEEAEVYVPFAVVTGMLLDKDSFTNVSAEGGRVISDGSRLAVVGIALPGLSQSLALEEDSEDLDIEIPEKLVVEADVTDFSLGTAYTFVTNFNVGNYDLDGESSDELFSGLMDEVTDAMDQLVDGSSQLYEGLVTAADGASQLVDGSNSAYEGAGQLADGAASAYEGAQQLADGAASAYAGSKQLADGAASAYDGASQLDAGIAQLVAGLNAITANNDALVSGSEQVFETLLATADKSLAAAGLELPALTMDNYSAVINAAIASLQATDVEAAARAQVEAQVEANRPTVEAAVTEAVKQQVTEKVLASLGMDSTSYAAAAAAGMVTEEQQAQIAAAVDRQMASDTVKALIAQNTDAKCEQLVEQYMASDDVQSQISAGKASIASGVASLTELKASLDSYNTYYQGIVAYTAGVSSAADGAGQLKAGSASLKTGLSSLEAGTASLKTGLGTLADGSTDLETGLGTLADGTLTLESGLADLADGNADLYAGLIELRDGAQTLSDGIAQLDDEFVSKIVDFINDDLGNFSERLKAVINVSEDYKSCNGLGSAEDGSVKFIYKIGEVK